MDAKALLKNKSICTIPYHGFELEPNGNIKNCIISTETLGNIQDNTIQTIIDGKRNVNLKRDMLDERKHKNCSGCHLHEKDRNDLVGISSRQYYLRELVEKDNLNFYDDPKNFKLSHVDIRWNNTCNQACVYCCLLYTSPSPRD